MSWIIITVFCISVLHFVYDGIILPSIRMHLRNRLFILRDELRRLKIEQYESFNERVFDFLHSGLNFYLNRLPLVTLSLRTSLMTEYHSNPGVQREAKIRMELVENCNSQELKNIHKSINEVLDMAYLANMGGWFFYIIPIAIVCMSFSKLSSLISEAFFLPEKTAGRIFENEHATA